MSEISIYKYTGMGVFVDSKIDVTKSITFPEELDITINQAHEFCYTNLPKEEAIRMAKAILEYYHA